MPAGRSIVDRFIERLMENWAKKIYVEVNPDTITFSCDGKMLQLKPLLYVAETCSGRKLLSVGGETGVVGGHAVYLFPESRIAVDDQVDLVDAFFRYAIIKLPYKRNRVRPIFYINGIGSLNKLCSGNQEYIFRKAALLSGAMKVYINGVSFQQTCHLTTG